MAGAGLCVAIAALIALSSSSRRRSRPDRVARH